MRTIQQIIQNNNWKSSTFKKSTDLNNLFNSGIVTEASEGARAIVNAVNEKNVQSTVTLGLVDYEWVEQNFGDASNTQAIALQPMFDEVNVKTFYGNQWWGVHTIQRDLMESTEPVRLVLNKAGKYWATTYNKIISATVSGMGDIAEITQGNGTEHFSHDIVTDARQKKGDMGWGQLSKMYMNSKMLHDIRKKQAAGTIDKDTVKAVYGETTITTDGVSTKVRSQTPVWTYDGVTPIVVDDAMKDGIVAMIDDGAFAYTHKDLADPIRYDSNNKSGNGAGKEEWGVKALYILHPLGFSFKGEHGTDYAARSGLSLAELNGGGLYELKVDAKLAPITNLKVKLGA